MFVFSAGTVTDSDAELPRAGIPVAEAGPVTEGIHPRCTKDLLGFPFLPAKPWSGHISDFQLVYSYRP